jgi:hypothetical protein
VADESPKQSFWTTLPGILTGMAAVLTAAGGIILGLHQSDSKEHQRPSATPSEVTERAMEAPPATGPAHAQAGALSAMTAEKSSAEKSTPAAVSKDVAITANDGNTTTVYPESFYFTTNRAVKLTTGQSIDFSQIKTVDLSGDDNRIDLKITLTSGEVVTGNSDYPSGPVMGQNRLGSFYAPLKKIKRITFPN